MSDDPHIAELLRSVPPVTDEWRQGWDDCVAHRVWEDAHRPLPAEADPSYLFALILCCVFAFVMGVLFALGVLDVWVAR